MRLKVIACKVLLREMSLVAARCNTILDFTWMRQGYHATPAVLQKVLQNEIDKIDADNDPYSCTMEQTGEKFDAIVLGYGLCSNGVLGLKSEKYPIVIPRAHDCITLFLGSKERYKQLFNELGGGVYWYTSGWVEHAGLPDKSRSERLYEYYLEKFEDEDTAEYLVETMTQSWMEKYNSMAYIEMPGGLPNYQSEIKECARQRNWKYIHFDGDLHLIEDMLTGNWNEKDFTIIPPGKACAASYDDNILKYE